MFNKKIIYDSVLRETRYPNLVDFQFAEKALYGKVNRQFIPIVLRSVDGALVGTGNDGTAPQGKRALNFVMDAFRDLAQKFQLKAALNEISPGESYLSNLSIHKAYESPQSQYNQYIQVYADAFEKIINEQKIEFSNFGQFVDKFVPFLQNALGTLPLTYPAFVKSRYCSPYSSGLVLAIADVESSNDEEKIKNFTSSPNWNFYVNACNTYGFMVDKNEPWKIVADIGSATMVEYARKYGMHSTDEILNNAYTAAHFGYLSNFRAMLYGVYMKNRKTQHRHRTLITSEGEKIVIKEAKMYTPQMLMRDYPIEYFINLYCDLRFDEEESDFSHAERFQLKDNILELYPTAPNRSMYIFERILNKTFDYNGSLTYIVNNQKKMRR